MSHRSWQAWLRKIFGVAQERRPRRRHGSRLLVEALEDRRTPSAAATPGVVLDHTGAGAIANGNSPQTSGGYTPSQIQQTYGFNQITFGSVQGNGAGETIAIVDAYSQPTLVADLQAFDTAFNLPDPPSLSIVDETGGSSLPVANTSWGLEESLDVEWAHAIAPAANIVLVEATSASTSDLMAGVNYVRNQPGVAVVSLSWGASEFTGETSNDSYFTTPSGNAGVTFVASSGDSGAGVNYPAASPNVLAVGGTNLTLDSNGNWSAETGWSGSGGGVSSYESQPGYQAGIVAQSSTNRAVPDVAYDADPNTGVAVIDSSYGSGGPWYEVGGTSAGAPQWSALIAIADQGRALAGEGSLDGATQTLPAIYHAPSADFHDITSGNNGYNAGPGYDLVTGLGTPIADLLVATLVNNTSSPAAMTVSALNLKNSSGTAITYGTPGSTITTTPTIADIGGMAANNVSIQITSGTSGVTVLGNPNQVIGTVNPNAPLQVPTAFQLQLSSSLTNMETVQLNFLITFTDSASGQQEQTTVSQTFEIVKTVPSVEARINWQPGALMADPTRDVVYVIDETNQRVVAINTDTGATVGQASLAGSTSLSAPVDTSGLESGQMAVSLDGTLLYVALSGSNEIQVFSLPTLTSVALYSYSFAPVGLACGVNNMLYVSTHAIWTDLEEVNGLTGAVIGPFDKGGANGTYYYDTILRTNPSGTHLYAAETGLMTVGGPAYVYEYDITGAAPQLVAEVPYQQTYMNDFAVDETDNQIYTLNGGPTNGVYGVEVSNSEYDTYGITWSLLGNPYGRSVALLPGSGVVYGAADNGTIVAYNEQTGAAFGSYSVGKTLASPELPDNALKITPNGDLMYVVRNGSNYSLGIIGATTLTLPLTVNGLSQTQWTVNRAGYSQTITTSGATGTVTFSYTGTIPPGTTFNDSTGVLNGTPNATGNFSFTVAATDSSGDQASKTFTLTINPAITLGTLAVTQWTAYQAGYSQQIPVSGGTGSLSFSYSGSLPAGFTLNPVTGVLSGTTTIAGTFSFTVTATDSVGATGTRGYNLTIIPAPLLLNALSQTQWTVNRGGYSQTITTTGGTGTITLSHTGTIPPGMTFTDRTGVLNGMPTSTGTFSFTVTATDGIGENPSQTYTLTINPAITLGALPVTQWMAYQSGYSQPIPATGGTGSLRFSSAGSLPTGFTLNPVTGVLSGTTTSAGTFSFTVTATDSVGATGTRSYSLTISPAPPVAQPDFYTVDENNTLNATSTSAPTQLYLNSQPGDFIGQGQVNTWTASGGTFTVNTSGNDNVVGINYVNTANPSVNWTLNFAAPNNGILAPGYYGNATRYPFEVSGVPGLNVSGEGRGSNTLTGSFTVLQASYGPSGQLLVFDATFVQHSEGMTPALSGEIRYNVPAPPGSVLLNDSDAAGNSLSAIPVTGPSHGNVTLNSNGTFTYVPNANFVGTDTFTYEATDGQVNSTPATVTITVNPQIALSSLAQSQWTVNQPGYNQAIIASGGTGALTLSESGALPAGITFNTSAGILSGTPIASGSFNFSITASDSTGAQTTQNYTLIINPAVTLGGLAQTQWTLNQAYNQTIPASAGTGVVTLSESGSLPDGLAFTNGVLSGTPTAIGTFSFTVTGTDATGASASQSYSITINPAPTLSDLAQTQWTSTQPVYSQTIEASGGTGSLALSHSGSIPTGLTFDDGNGVLSGTPTAVGSFTFSVTATDSTGAQATQSDSITINPAITLSSLTQTQWTQNQSGYSQTIVASGGTGALTLATSGSIPTGLTFDPSSGTLTGIPTVSGTFGFSVTATDSIGAQTTESYSVTINSPTIILSTLSQMQWTLNQPGYSQAITASGGTGPFTFAASASIPTGLTFDASTGVLSGTPTVAGSFAFSVTATDITGDQTTQSYAVTINPAVSLGNLAQTQWTLNQTGCSQTITASGGTGSLALSTSGSIPAGLTFNTSTGVLSGTPTATGTFVFGVTATDGIGAQTTQSYSITINPAVSLGNLAQTQWTLNQAGYSQTITASGGTGSLALSTSGSIPAGMTFNADAGVLSGTPTATGTFVFGVTATDGIGAQTTQSYSITINPAASLGNLAQTQWTLNQAGYSQTITASGGTGSLALSTSGSIPAGMTFNADAGVLSGTPTATGTFVFGVTATDGIGAQTTQSYSITINPAASLGNLAQTQWTLNQAGYSQTITASGGTGSLALSTSGSIPAGMTFNADAGVLSGTPTATGTFVFGVTATDGIGAQTTQSYSITINPAASLGSLAQTQWTLNQAGYSQTITASGGTGSLALSTSGSIPAGMTFNADAGVLSGTPTATGTFVFGVTATDGIGAQTTQSYSITINPAASLGSLAQTQWTLNQTGYSQTITASGGTGSLALSTSGSIPAGLTFNTSTGVLGGTPTVTGTFVFSVTATDGIGAQSTQSYSITINPAPSLGSLGQTNWLANQAGYSQTITASGGTGSVTLSQTGSIPPGLTFSVTTGLLIGTPTTAGTYRFTVIATDAVGAQASQTYSLTINPAITFNNLSQTQWTINRAGYSQTVTASGGAGGITLSHSGTIPTGMTFNNSTGVLSGTPTAAGTYTLAVTATDKLGEQATYSYTITINPAPTLGALSTAQWTINQSHYSGTIAVGGGTGPFGSLSVSGLPSGVTASLSNGIITLSGTPTQSGTFTVHVSAKDVTGATVSASYSLVINKAMSLGNLSITTWKVNQSGQTATIAISNGTPAYSIVTVTGLPPGLNTALSGSTITLSGTPTKTGSYSVQITIEDSSGATVTKSYTITVRN